MGSLAEPRGVPNLPSMLRIEQIRLTQFKNHPDTHYTFEARVVGITGPNGVGKTNLLDALHTLCFSRGYFSRTDQHLVRHGEMGFRIDGRIRRQEQLHTVGLILRETGKKEIWLDGDALPRITDHVGRFPVVMIAPDDAEWILGESRIRRQFLDALISQLDPSYLLALTKYNRILQQRQALLREIGERGQNPERSDLLDVLDQQWAEGAAAIWPAREKWTRILETLVAEQYRSIAGESDAVRIEYQTDGSGLSPLERIRSARTRDLAAQRNTIGPHRDDLLFLLGAHPFRQVASQGQRKTLLFALKLAERFLLEKELGLAPILLLDDVFEKLDPGRMRALLEWVAHQTVSQVFITDTDAHRLRDQLDPMKIQWQSLEIRAGA